MAAQEHLHQCPTCMPRLFPSTQREDDNPNYYHVDHERSRQVARVLLDGQDVTNACRIAMVGPDGWVQVYTRIAGQDGAAHRCTCGEGACQDLLRGDVTVELKLPA